MYEDLGVRQAAGQLLSGSGADIIDGGVISAVTNPLYSADFTALQNLNDTDIRGLAITRKGLGTYNLQQLAASSYFLAVKDWAAQNGYDGNKISFTGHSLGGGLASNMAVWFDRPATTFAEAPFELSAVNPLAVTAAAATLTLQAGVTASAAVLEEITKLTDIASPGVYEARQNAVTNYYNKGEFLEYARAVIPTVVGNNIAIDIGDQSILKAGDLHSMNLHAAFLYDDRLRELAKTIPELVPALVDKSLFAADPNYKTKDLITTLVNDQLRQGFDADSALKRFTTDIDKLKGTAGTATTETWRKALIAVAMDYHYNADAASSKTFFTAESGAIHFDLNDINATQLKSLPLLRTAASSTATGGDPFNTASAWHVQTGAGGMNWLDSAGVNDVAIGGAQDDVLRAGAGSDYVVGGAGADILDGGSGNDTLLGGAGLDTYLFTDQFGSDTLLDTDGQGSIKIADTTLTGGKKLGEGTWESDDKTIIYTQIGTNLVISTRPGNTASGSITIKNFTSGQLGLTLDGQAATAAPAPTAQTTFNLIDEAGRTSYERANTIASTADLFVENAATTFNAAPYLGADPIWRSYEFVRTGSGADVIEGGSFNAVSDVLYNAGAGNDRIYANTTVSLADAIARGDDPSTVALDSSRYVLDGGAGNDQIIGSDARDVLFGGAGDDTLVGGAGGDIIIADGNSGGLLDGYYGSISDTDPMIVDGPATSIGNTASLRIAHTGLWLGQTDLNNTRGYVTLAEAAPTQYLNPLYSADYTALLGITDSDLRGLGYGMELGQPIGEHVRYLGSDAIGALSTNKETGNDVIFAGAGDDVVNAGAGNDIVVAGDGNDNVAGYEGDDYITGGAGNDVLVGDSFVMGAGDGFSTSPNLDLYTAKLLINGYSIDTSQHGRDMISGGSGNDQIEGGGKDDTLYGDEGNDVICGDDSAALINGAAAGNDVIDGGAGDDKLLGGAGQDNITGGEGNDFLLGDWQQDDFAGGGADTLEGGDGNDTMPGTLYLIATHAFRSMATGQFDCESWTLETRRPCLRWRFDRSNIKTAHAGSMRLARHIGQGRRMDAAWGSSGIQTNTQKWEVPQ